MSQKVTRSDARTRHGRSLIVMNIYSNIIKNKMKQGIKISDTLMKRFSVVCEKYSKLKNEDR
jgi:hypothetical protein